MSLYDTPLHTIDGRETTFGEHAGQAVLVVNVASRCGLTPQYATLEALQDKYADQGFTVVGFPCNQFGGQEPGSAEQIQEFCSTTYGVSFPLYAKGDVNGPDRQPIYQVLCQTPYADGTGGDIRWNFEKFLVGPDGSVVARFRPKTLTDDPEVVAAIEAVLPKS